LEITYENQRIPSVSELTNAISKLIREGIGYVTVCGEISNFKAHSSGHRYFTLKDDNAAISCTLWKTRSLNFIPKEGMKVIAQGEVTVYPPRGSYQLECIRLIPLGQGELFAAFEALKQKLGGKGYFESSRKKPLPYPSFKIGISTSPTGAAVQDMFSTIERRFPAAEIIFRPTIVQGDDSAMDIADAIMQLSEYKPDIIIIGRGGGSIEDLWSYNTEIVADAIFNCKIPVISAVGHETDFTIADFVADVRAATPTAAAELATPVTLSDLLASIDSAMENMNNVLNLLIRRFQERIEIYSSSYSFRSIMDKLSRYVQETDEAESRMDNAVERIFKNTRQKISSLEAHCLSLNPLNPLKKGFAILKDNNKIISNKESLKDFQKITIIRENETATASISIVLPS
jgi:exodeoxyribonuclease VII large subunit